MINYLLMALGIFSIMISVILIFLDKIKGEDIYFNIDVKEQEIRKVMEDADEIISELNYTSDVVVKEIEEKLADLKEAYRTLNASSAATASSPVPEKKESITVTVAPPARKKRVLRDSLEKEKELQTKLNPKQQAVFDCAAQGMSITDIAKQLNIGQGEVKLILSLKNEVE